MPYTHLIENERYAISHMSLAGFSIRKMVLRKIALVLPVVILIFAFVAVADTIVDYTYDKDGTMKTEAINSSTPQISISADPFPSVLINV